MGGKNSHGVKMINKCFLILVITGLVCIADTAYSNPEIIDLNAISLIESSNNPRAINKDEGSFGLFQISPVALKEFNQRVGANLTMKDMLREEKNAHVAIWLLEVRIPELLAFYKKPQTLKNTIVAYNCGISCLDRKELPKTTKEYLAKYRRITGEKV